ncbi:glycosyltransferase family 2 protein [Geotalea uraniireducens]|uniref:Glycosyl transferase, family 2 n=1 Tax=Geotalea uraniireducens (strain Rf4) TaxID=351605 RepID=A5G839_GEOUR|nr:glycosyltransferase family 2 protein [Geotalea uraniireducens]ABQ27957.1 glycosyl transferase, family 2 [Geotalea uraniireducens Rf4]
MAYNNTFPSISIVTPSFNQGEFLEKCIDSILSQNYPNLEYIIMDGGSSDNSIEIIKKYEKYLTYWQSKPDGGHYAALNEGFKRSNGEVMGWLNSDDMFHPGGLFVLAEIFSEMPEVNVLTGRRVGFDAMGHLNSYGIERQTWSREILLDQSYVHRYAFIMQEATYWRRSLWEKAGEGLDLSFELAADFELWLRFSRHAQIHTVDALIAGFRFYGPAQRSQIMRDEYIRECESAIESEKSVRSDNLDLDAIAPPLIKYPPSGSTMQIFVKNPPPKFSIVTPSFNQGEFLEECIDSVLGQNYPNLEFIIMDGGSTDKSVDIIKKYEKHLVYWQSQPDGGQYNAINDGFKKTSGEIMAWLNSDDKYHHVAFYKVAYSFSRFRNIEWLTGRPAFWDKDGDMCGVFDYLPGYNRVKILNKAYNDPFIQQESTFWKRSLWQRAGGELRTDLDYAGDLELWNRFFRHAELYTVDTLLGGYRSHGNQKAALFMDRYVAESEKILDEEMVLYRKNGEAGLSSAPDPVSISAREVKAYIDDIYSVSNSKPFTLSDDSDRVIACLLRKVEELRHVSAQLACCEADSTAQNELHAMRNSLSWRLTKPLRCLADRLRR